MRLLLQHTCIECLYKRTTKANIYVTISLLLSEYKHYLLNIHIKIPKSKIITESFISEDRSAKHFLDTCNIEHGSLVPNRL